MDMEQLSLFDTEAVYDPLASRMRPEDLDEFAGQTNLLGKGSFCASSLSRTASRL